MPALIVGFAGYAVARIFVQNWLRQRYETPLTTTWPARSGFTKPKLDKAWILELRPSDRLGHAIAPPLNPLHACETRGDRRASRSSTRHACPPNLYNHAVYQPASRFWLFQGIETAIFGGVAVVADPVRGVVDPRADRAERQVGRTGARRGSSAGAPKLCSTSGMSTLPSLRWCVSSTAISVRDDVTAVPLSVCRWRTPASLR